MKTLLFLRHGKSDWDADFSTDHERPLAGRGRKAAATMGRFIAACGVLPDRIVTSTAERARTTVEIAMAEGGWTAPVRETRALYMASPADLLVQIRAEDDAASVLLLVGHEPTWGTMVSRLIGGGAVRYPTAAFARVDLGVARWQDVAFGHGELIWLVPPKALGD